ncbi:hypothetical protein HN51_016718, partial [Arachis hypogaea]
MHPQRQCITLPTSHPCRLWRLQLPLSASSGFPSSTIIVVALSLLLTVVDVAVARPYSSLAQSKLCIVHHSMPPHE